MQESKNARKSLPIFTTIYVCSQNAVVGCHDLPGFNKSACCREICGCSPKFADLLKHQRMLEFANVEIFANFCGLLQQFADVRRNLLVLASSCRTSPVVCKILLFEFSKFRDLLQNDERAPNQAHKFGDSFSLSLTAVLQGDCSWLPGDR